MKKDCQESRVERESLENVYVHYLVNSSLYMKHTATHDFQGEKGDLGEQGPEGEMGLNGTIGDEVNTIACLCSISIFVKI